MTKGRLEAFSDGVIAILITIMVLELRPPAGADWHALRSLGPRFCNYLLSFVFLGIYWNNHHHLLHATTRVSGRILWANLHLLFWLSLVPMTTSWLGESHLAPLPTASYGLVFLAAACAWTILQASIIRLEGGESKVAQAVGRDWKGKVSASLYAAGVVTAFFAPAVAVAFYVLVALFWLVPDRRIEGAFGREQS
jgi:uncharacterized membrane protein